MSPSIDQDDVQGDVELLTAYLDGELEPSDRDRVQMRLAREESLRRRLQELREVDDLLDVYPTTPVSRQFTTTTIQLAAASADPSQSAGMRRLRIDPRVWALPVAIGITLAAVAIGSAAGYRERQERRWQREQAILAAAALPTLMLPALSDPDVLRELERFPYLDALESTELSRQVLRFPPPDTDELADWVEQLDPRSKDLLRQRADDYQSLDPATRAELNQRWGRLRPPRGASEADREAAAETQRTASIFTALLDAAPSNVRSEILTLPTEEMIDRLYEEAYLKVAMWYGENMTSSDRQAINRWLERFVDRGTDSGEASAEGVSFEHIRRFFWQVVAEPEQQDDLIDALAFELNEDARTMLYNVAARNRTLVLRTWAECAQGYGEQVNPSDEDLIRRYGQLVGGEQEWLDYEHRERVRRHLQMSLQFARAAEQRGGPSQAPASPAPPPGGRPK